MAVASQHCMGWICEHAVCAIQWVGLSREDGGIRNGLFDMIVCHPCRIEAQQLGLYTEEIPLHSMLNASSEMKKV